MRKVTLILLCVLLVVGLAAACSGSNNSNVENGSASPDTSKRNVELRVSWWGGDSRHQKWNEVLDGFEDKYPHITVKREFTDFNGYWDKLATQAAGVNAPDVIMQVMHKFAEYAERDQLMVLDDLIDSGQIDLSDWGQSIIDSGKLNGKTYMVSYGNTSSAVLYNASMFEEVGVAPPTMNWNWEEFVNKANEIQAKLPSGVWAIEDLGGYDIFFTNWNLSRGKDFYDKDGQLGFDKEDMIQYLAMWEGLRQSGAVPPASVQAEYPSERPEQTMIAQGKVSMFVRPQNQLTAFQNGTADRLELAMVPSGTTSGHDLGGAYVSLYSKTKHPEEALLLLNYLISDTDAASIMKTEYGPMGSKQMNDFLSPLLPEAEQTAINFMGSITEYINVQNHPPAGANEVTRQFLLAHESVAFGQSSIEQAVDNFFNEADKILK